MSSPREVTVLGSTGSIGRQAIEVARQNPDRLRITGLAAGGGDVARLADQALAPRRPHRRRRPRHRRPGPAAGLLRGGVPARLGEGRVRAAGDPRRPTGGRGARRPARRRRPQRDHRLHRARPDAVGAASRPHRRPGEQGVAGRRGRPGHRRRGTRAAGPGRLRALGAGPVPARRRPRRGRPARAHRQRRPVPRPGGRRPRRRHGRRGAGAPHLGHGPGRHDQLRDPGQQGARADRGAPALRRPLRRHRRRGAPAVDRALDGHLRRRRDDRAGQPAGHAAADRARPGLARPAARRPARAGLVDGEHLGVRPARRGRLPGGTAGRQAGEAGGVVPALYNAANEEAVAAFVAGRLSFRGIVDLVARTLDDAPDLGAPTCVEDVLAAEKWAREHARGVISGGRS